MAESDNEDEQSEESSKKGEVELNAMNKTLQNGNNEPQSSQHNKVFKDQHKTWGNQGAPNYPKQNQMNNPQCNTFQNHNQGNNWNNQGTQGNNCNNQGNQGNN